MTHEILKILDTTDLQELEKQRITTDLLRLFNVVGRSEQLRAFCEWTRENLDQKDIVTQEAVDSYLESL